MQRRTILGILAAAPLFGARALGATPNADMSVQEPLNGWKALSDAGWKQRLAPAQYDVLRHEGTEAAGSSPLNGEKRPGIFACAGCALPLFDSSTKYDSTGSAPPRPMRRAGSAASSVPPNLGSMASCASAIR